MVTELGVVVGGLVGLMKAWLDYDKDKSIAQQAGKDAPTPSDAATQGQQAMEVVQQGVAQYGDKKDQRALENFVEEPQDYADALKSKLIALAQQHPTFAQQLQQMGNQVQQAGVQITHSEIKAYDQATIHQAIGVNTGTMTYNEGK